MALGQAQLEDWEQRVPALAAETRQGLAVAAWSERFAFAQKEEASQGAA